MYFWVIRPYFLLSLSDKAKGRFVLESNHLNQLEDHYGRATLVKEIRIFSRLNHTTKSLWAIVVPNMEIFKKDNDTDIYGRVRWELENLQTTLPADQRLAGIVLTRGSLNGTEKRKNEISEMIQRYQNMPKTIAFNADEPMTFEEQEILKTDIARKIIKYVSTLTPRPVYLNSHWEIDLDIDSLGRVEIALRMEELFNIKITDELYYKATTVKELIDLVASLTPKWLDGKVSKPKGWGEILKQTPTGEISKDAQIRIKKRTVVLNWFAGGLLWLIFKICWSLKAEGVKNLPSKGPFIICPNHSSFLDGLFIYNNLPFKHQIHTNFFGYYNIFYHPSMKNNIKLARLVAIDNNLHLKESLQIANLLLANQKIACIFPEGMRSISDNIGPFYKGAAILAKELGVPIVPAFIHGSNQSWPRGSNKPRLCSVKVVFGRPFYADELASIGSNGVSGDIYEKISRGLRAEVIKLREGEVNKVEK